MRRIAQALKTKNQINASLFVTKKLASWERLITILYINHVHKWTNTQTDANAMLIFITHMISVRWACVWKALLSAGRASAFATPLWKYMWGWRAPQEVGYSLHNFFQRSRLINSPTRMDKRQFNAQYSLYFYWLFISNTWKYIYHSQRRTSLSNFNCVDCASSMLWC